MNLFGLEEKLVRSLAGGVRPGGAPVGGAPSGDARERPDGHDQVDGPDPAAPIELAADAELFARAAWTTIAEPGDGVAGAVVERLGAVRALTAVVEGWSPERLSASLNVGVDENGAGDPAGLLGELSQALSRWRPRLSSAEVIRSLQQARRTHTALLLPGDPLWPDGVDDLGRHAPLALWWRGRPEALAALRHSIALVGARAATGYGEHVAMEASAGLVDRGLAIVSGAAYGIDGMAHRSALASNGTTVAFLAGGVDRFYPSGHDALLTRIVEAGAVMSELPCGAAPTKWRFLHQKCKSYAWASALAALEWIEGFSRAVSGANPDDHDALRGDWLGIKDGAALGTPGRGREAVLVDLGVHGLEAELDRIVDIGVCPELGAQSRALGHGGLRGESHNERGSFVLGVTQSAHGHEGSGLVPRGKVFSCSASRQISRALVWKACVTQGER
ncbi:DNA-processing protein DprA [Cryobacterium soli]|uniref:DNA-processing protein DprA n=1 Tax=Cryobacterium soli TaxID=2220095 RepID=UPI000E71801D|nr:DNA-processing protein DprA [Cryobacterium soli]